MISTYCNMAALKSINMGVAPMKSFLSVALIFTFALTAQTPTPAVPTPSRELTPSTLNTKGKWWLENTVGVNALLGSAIPAALRMASPSRGLPPEWRQGAGALGRQFGHYYVMNATSYTVAAGFAALTGEDPRYHPSTGQGFPKRFGHALLSTFIARGDGGGMRPAVSVWAGAVAGGFVSKAYMPNGFNDSVHAGQWTLINFANFASENVRQEFSPEFKRVAKKLHIPFAGR